MPKTKASPALGKAAAKRKAAPFVSSAVNGFFSALAEVPDEDRPALTRLALNGVRAKVKDDVSKAKAAKAKTRAKNAKLKARHTNRAGKIAAKPKTYAKRVRINDMDAPSPASI